MKIEDRGAFAWKPEVGLSSASRTEAWPEARTLRTGTRGQSSEEFGAVSDAGGSTTVDGGQRPRSNPEETSGKNVARVSTSERSDAGGRPKHRVGA